MGRIQSAFVRELESGKHKQTDGVLCEQLPGKRKPCYCVMGLLALVLWELGYEVEWVYRSGCWNINGHTDRLPKTLEELACIRNQYELIQMNDDSEITFKDFAQRIRKSPETYFTSPA